MTPEETIAAYLGELSVSIALIPDLNKIASVLRILQGSILSNDMDDFCKYVQYYGKLRVAQIDEENNEKVQKS